MRINDFDVLHIVVAISTSDLIQEIKALLQLLVELDVMNGLTHLFNLSSQLIFLIRSKLIVMISTLSESDLETNLSLL
jgi:hypothetical protein